MTKDMMRVVLNKDNIKKIMKKHLNEAGIRIQETEFDIVVVELPDNKANIMNKHPIERDIQVWISDHSMEQRIKSRMEKSYEELAPAEVCKSIIKILKRRNGEAFSCRHTIKSGRIFGSAGEYHLLIFMRLDESVSGYAELFKYIINNIKEKLEAAGDFLQMSATENGRQRLFGDMQKRWILFGKFAEYYMLQNGLPEPGILTQLSAARYEGSESEARIYFTKKALDTVEKFNADNKRDRIIVDKNQRMIRKLMEISKHNTVHLYAEKSTEKKSGKTIHTVTELVQCREKQEKDIYVKFSGFMHWSLFIEDREIFTYYHGEYRFNVSKEKYTYLNEIKKLQNFDRSKKDMIAKLVKILAKQKHGTVAIIFDEKADALSEVKKLCGMKRGTKILATICYNEKNGWNEEQILAVSGIDGALLIDCNGKCLAIGVIVDGETVKKGDVGRGARYNSIANYVTLKPGRVGIVVSEDGMINVLQEQPIIKAYALSTVQNV